MPSVIIFLCLIFFPSLLPSLPPSLLLKTSEYARGRPGAEPRGGQPPGAL